MRSLHRDIGFFLIGLTVIYCVSGVILTYRNIDFLKQVVTVKKQLDPNLRLNQVARKIHKRGVTLIRDEGDSMIFNYGTYHKATGVVVYQTKRLPFPLNAFSTLHKTSGRGGRHYFTVLYGIGLLFLAISSFWMYSPNSKRFKRGVMLAGAGVIASILLLFV